MLEVYTSTVAWISVVVVQALMHYFVFGARRERIQKQVEAELLNESLSFSTSEGSIDLDTDIIDSPNALTRDPSFSYMSSDQIATEFETVPTIHDVPINGTETYRTGKTPLYLTQTGTEILKVWKRKFVCF
jgi:hypothetical protein